MPPVLVFSLTSRSLTSTSPLPSKRRFLRVGEIDELIGRELRMHRDFEKAALLDRHHLRRARHRLRIERAAAHDAQRAALLGDQHVAVGQERKAPRRRKALEHRRDAHRQSGRLDDLRRIRERQRRDALKSSRRRALPSAALWRGWRRRYRLGEDRRHRDGDRTCHDRERGVES
jgi:hypothetical protein